MGKYCFINGETLPVEEATIGITDLGLLRSYAVFDYLRTYNKRPYQLQTHLTRFRNSANEYRLDLPYSDHELTSIINDLLERSTFEEAGIRLVLTGGYSGDSMSSGKPNVLIVVEECPRFPDAWYQKGVKLITSEYLRDTPLAKSTNYINAIKLRPLIEEQGAYDVLYVHKGKVLEVARNNFFIFKGDVIVTPKEDILLGTTRKTVLELANKEFEVQERELKVDELAEADEAFLTGSTKKIIPVVQIDELQIGVGKPGPNTQRLMHLFDEYLDQSTD